jgi:release factor glutamine methyltransferase
LSAPNLLIDILTKAEKYLAEKVIPSPRLEAQLIFAHILGLRRIDLFTQPDRPLEAAELEKLRAALKEKAVGVPTAHILGTRDFYGRPFVVTPDTLIPRPETEELVEQILAAVKTARHVVDLGTGTGCIGITIAAETEVQSLTLVDLSAAALRVARQNAASLLKNSVTMTNFLEADFTASMPQLGEIDLIVSNPPYVLAEEYENLDVSVRKFEPRMALVPDDFQTLHKNLLAASFSTLADAGLLAIETHPAKSALVAEWAGVQGYSKVEIRNDLAARPHFIFAWK